MRGILFPEDMSTLPKGDQVAKFVYDHIILLAILIIGAAIWVELFNLAVVDYLDSNIWRIRGVWLGTGEFDLFGYTISYQFEGYTDYSFYYVHWGTNMLRGVMPYDNDFGYIVLDGFTNENGAYMFPPFSAYLYAAGMAIPVDNWGIGFIIAIFGYLTALPVYGLGKELSKNRHVGEAAALTYLLNPNVLYHSVFAWLNPAPFIFFFFAGFYMLVRGHKNVGTILIVCAALFKQTAWFLGIPLVVYLLVRPKSKEIVEELTVVSPDEQQPLEDSTEERVEQADKKKKPILEATVEYFDIRGFLSSAVMVIIFGLAIMFPFILATPNFLRNLSLAAGGFPLESFTELPGYGSPMRLQVLAVAAGFPELAQFLDFLVYYGFLLSFGVILAMGIMLLERRESDRPLYYMRRLLFLTLLLMLWVHLMGPRGVYKYYFTLFAPFFSIFASSKMVTSTEESVPFSFSMLWLPIAMSLAIVIPQREIYLFCVLLLFIGYLLAYQIGVFWSAITAPIRYLSKFFPSKMPMVNRIREKRGPRQSRTFSYEGHTLRVEFIGALDQIFRKQKILVSRLFYDNEVVSECRIKAWSEDGEPLESLSHHLVITEGETKVTYEVNHLSTISLDIRLRRNGEDISLN